MWCTGAGNHEYDIHDEKCQNCTGGLVAYTNVLSGEGVVLLECWVVPSGNMQCRVSQRRDIWRQG